MNKHSEKRNEEKFKNTKRIIPSPYNKSKQYKERKRGILTSKQGEIK